MEDRDEVIAREIARSHIAGMLRLLQDYAQDILDDICDMLPEPDDTWSDVDQAKRKLTEACEVLEHALEISG